MIFRFPLFFSLLTISSSSSPNVIFIFADDLGNADVGYQGSDILTPHIDTLARSGVILNQHYVLPQCSPSRAAFMTGRYPIHTGFHSANIVQGELWGLGLDEFTVGELFQEYGYRTHAVGKWHLGWRTWQHTPVSRGFDTFLGFYFCAHDHYQYHCGLSGVTSDGEEDEEKKKKKRRKKRKKSEFDTDKKVKKKRRIPKSDNSNSGNYTLGNDKRGRAKDKSSKEKIRYFDLRENYFSNETQEIVDEIRWDLRGRYSANVLTDATIDRIRNRGTEPFFIYLNYMNVHSPYQAPRHYIKKYTEHMSSGSSSYSRKIYAAMVSSMDEGIGNITQVLKEEGIYNNTILVFASDNGANVGSCREDMDKFDTTPNRMDPGSNAPLRGGKRTLYEGGVKSVSFVHSPLIKQPGRQMDDMMHVVDWMSTFEEIISEEGPRLRVIRERLPSDSISLWNSISRGSKGERNQFLLNINTRGSGMGKCGALSQPFKGIRKNNWKLLIGGGGEPSGWYSPGTRPVYTNTTDAMQLFNIDLDPTESENVLSDHPDIVMDLLKELRSYKETMTESIRRKQTNLSPYIQGLVPTPLHITDSRNDESYFVDPK